MVTAWQTAYLSLGSNQGDRLAFLHKAVERLESAAGVVVTAVSSIYETDPVGFLDQADFYNCVVEIRVSLSAHELLNLCQKIENSLGRQRKIRWGPRTIDIDILTYGGLCLNSPELILPHPRMAERDFVMLPLLELKEGVPKQIEKVRLVLADWYPVKDRPGPSPCQPG